MQWYMSDTRKTISRTLSQSVIVYVWNGEYVKETIICTSTPKIISVSYLRKISSWKCANLHHGLEVKICSEQPRSHLLQSRFSKFYGGLHPHPPSPKMGDIPLAPPALGSCLWHSFAPPTFKILPPTSKLIENPVYVYDKISILSFSISNLKYMYPSKTFQGFKIM